jgi:hypothetical protein
MRGPLPRRGRSRAPGRASLLPRRGRPRALIGLAGMLALAAGLLAGRLVPGASPRCQQISVPAYFYPGADWARAVGSRPGIMIVDITSSGAGSAPDPNYQAAAQQAQAAGIKVLGYAATDYARRPAAAVEADIRNYRAWYHVTDIFLDEAATGSSKIPYYRRLTDYIKDAAPASLVMLNPGTYPSRQYMSLGDVVLAYEGSYAGYAGLRVPGWARRYPADRFSHVVYATPGPRLAEALRLAAGRHAGYVYITDKAGPNPYRSLPGYWAAENAIVAAVCQGQHPPANAGHGLAGYRRHRLRLPAGVAAGRPGSLHRMAPSGQGRGEQRPVDVAGDVG